MSLYCILCNTAVVYCVKNILRGSAISSEFDISRLSYMLCTEGSGPCGGLPRLKGHVSHMLVGALWLHVCFNLVISPENCEHFRIIYEAKQVFIILSDVVGRFTGCVVLGCVKAFAVAFVEAPSWQYYTVLLMH